MLKSSKDDRLPLYQREREKKKNFLLSYYGIRYFIVKVPSRYCDNQQVFTKQASRPQTRHLAAGC